MPYNTDTPEFETPFRPKVYGGPPPGETWVLPNGDWAWRCECGATGISSDRDWADSDVNRHRQNGNHEVQA